MKQLETKMKIMQEEHQKKSTQLAASNPGGHIVLEKQVRVTYFSSSEFPSLPESEASGLAILISYMALAAASHKGETGPRPPI